VEMIENHILKQILSFDSLDLNCSQYIKKS
jgi:hypothetical protein